MKELILDLRPLADDDELGGEFVDMPERIQLEELILDYSGKVIRIKVYVVAPSRLAQ